MPFLPTGSIRRMWRGPDEIAALFHGGTEIWRKPAAPTIADLYGTGLGQVPTDFIPNNASLSGAQVATLPNSGGAGAAFDLTAQAGSDITLSGDYLDIDNTSATSYLSSANLMDLMGTRLFMVEDLSLAVDPVYILGKSTAPPTNIRFRPQNDQIGLLRNNGGTNELVTLAWPGISSGLHLVEIEMIPEQARLFVDGVQMDVEALPVGWTDYLINRIGRGQANPGVSGLLGRQVVMITDGSSAYDDHVALIRSELAAQYPGLSL